MFTITALYKFVSLPDYVQLQPQFLDFCNEQGIKGTLLLAQEGINGTICGTDAAITAFHAFLKADPRFSDVEHKESYAEEQAFLRMKVRLKKEIVTLGVSEVDPKHRVGTYVDPKDWNDLISDPEVLVVDTRNDYEYRIGTFKGAIDPETVRFSQFPDYVKQNLDPQKHKRIATFCTGGIRCEKATSYLLGQGFQEVYHLKGGILKYLEHIPQENSLWDGECFVFDKRVAVGHGLVPGDHELCHGCRYPISEADKESPYYEKDVQCPHCYASMTDDKRARARERAYQMRLAEARGFVHLGDAGRNERHFQSER